METNRKDIRAAFKSIGYSVSFQRNPFNPDICNLGFKTPDMLKPIVCNSSNCFSSETFEKHRLAFDLATSYKGQYLVDTEQKIV